MLYTYNAHSIVSPQLNRRYHNLYTLIHPSHTLGHQKFLQSHLRIKPSPSTRLDTTMRQRRFILNSHAVDMHRPALISINLIKKCREGRGVPRLNLPRHSKRLPQILRKHRRRQPIPTRVRNPYSLLITPNNHTRSQRRKVLFLPHGHVLLNTTQDDRWHADA